MGKNVKFSENHKAANISVFFAECIFQKHVLALHNFWKPWKEILKATIGSIISVQWRRQGNDIFKDVKEYAY